MYMHMQNWSAAMRVAEAHEPGMVSDVLAAKAKATEAEPEPSAEAATEPAIHTLQPTTMKQLLRRVQKLERAVKARAEQTSALERRVAAAERGGAGSMHNG